MLAVALVVTLSGRTADPLAPDGSAVALRAEPGLGATGAVRLSSRPWGTQVDLRVDRLPIDASGEGYAVWLLRADGRRIPAGTFRPASGAATSRVRLPGAVPPGRGDSGRRQPDRRHRRCSRAARICVLTISTEPDEPFGPALRLLVRRFGERNDIAGVTPERLRRTYARRTWQAGTHEPELARILGIGTLRELRSFLMKDPAIRRTPVATR